jgi:hypothetical protein
VPYIGVDWYAKGAIFKANSPGLIGIGDGAQKLGGGLTAAGEGLSAIAANAWDAGLALGDFIGRMNDARRAAEDAGRGITSALSGLDFRATVNVDVGPLPHFWMAGGFNTRTGAVPYIGVDWYAKGAIFKANSPGLIGIGDAPEPEVTAPLSDLRKMLGETGRAQVNINVTVEGRAGEDYDELGRRIGERVAFEAKARGLV